MKSRTGLAVLIAAAASALAIGGLAASADSTTTTALATASASPAVVTIKNFAFSPNIVSIPVGGSVTWTNLDQAAHTATDKNGAFDSGNLDNGKSFTFKFAKAGTFHYVCTYHASMAAIVVVGGKGTPSPAPPDTSGY